MPLEPKHIFGRQISVSSKTDPGAALIKCIRFFFLSFKYCILVQSVDFQEMYFFSLSSQEQGESWDTGVQEDRQINKAKFVVGSSRLILVTRDLYTIKILRYLFRLYN